MAIQESGVLLSYHWSTELHALCKITKYHRLRKSNQKEIQISKATAVHNCLNINPFEKF